MGQDVVGRGDTHGGFFLRPKFKLLLHFSIYEIKKKTKKGFSIKICAFYKLKSNFILLIQNLLYVCHIF